MPPRIRSPSYSDEEGSDDSGAEETSARQNQQQQQQQQSNRRASTSSNTSALPTAQPTDDDDLSSLADSDQNGMDQDEDASGSEEEEEEEEDDDDNMEGSGRGEDENAYSDGSDQEDDDEFDDLENESVPINRRGSTSSSAVVQSTGGVKIKFKLGGNSGSSVASSVKASPKRERWNGGSEIDSRSKSSKGKGKSKRREQSMSDLSDDEDISDASVSSSILGANLTVRQRARGMAGEQDAGVEELQSLPNIVKGSLKSGVKLTEAELALKRSEVSRKRKSQSDQKLEIEKTETINRLLKKQVGRQRNRSKLSTSTSSTHPVNSNNQSTGGPEEGDELNITTTIMIPIIPVMERWISSIKDGEYKEMIGIPVGRKELGGTALIVAGKGYPGPRPPLKTRRFEKVLV